MSNGNKIVSRDALEDTRPVELRANDYSTEEVATASAVTPFKHKRPTKLKATEFNQYYAGSCVPHAFLTALEYEGIATPDISRLRAYRKRSNYPQAGSIGVDMFNKIRAGQSNDFPTPKGFTEAMATAMPYVEGVKIIKDFTFYQYIDKKTGALLLEQVPADVAIGKAVPIFIYATEDEWSRQYVEVGNEPVTLENAYVRHAVCIVPEGDFKEKGKRWLTVQDSAKFGGRGMRYVEYDKFFLTRTYFASKVYATGTLPAPEPENIPVLKPITACVLGDRGVAVLALQKYLIEDKKLAPEYATGYYGALTAKAVLWWQLEHWDKYQVNIPQLLDWRGEYWGEASVAIINSK
jgi:hypothetical protein